MKTTWYFDFISPFAYLQWAKIKQLSSRVDFTFRPILFAGLLARNETKGPAEIAGKREFTYRHVLWQARQEGVALRFPPAHPFNPLAALRLCVAAGSTVQAVDALFDWIWKDGNACNSLESLAPVAASLGIDPAMLQSETAKAQLRANTEAAIAAGVYGVPTLGFDGHLFWGNDAHDFAIAALRNPAVLADPEMQRVSALPIGIQRR